MRSDVITRDGTHELLVHLFTAGWCPLLACAFMQLHPDRFELVETDEGNWHVAVVDRDGQVWDITGPRPSDVFVAQWGPYWPAIVLDPDAEAAAAAGDWYPAAKHLTTDVFGVVDRHIWHVVQGLAGDLLAVHADQETAA